MSRHQTVRNLDLLDELDDYDGGEAYDYEDGADETGLSVADKEKLRNGVIEVREALGPDIVIADKEIEDSLWYYYYDVAKAVTWLLNQRTATTQKQPKKHKGKAGAKDTDEAILENATGISPLDDGAFVSSTCGALFSTADFFRDTPWLHVPPDRLGEIILEPLYPRGGLLGGSSRGEAAGSNVSGKPSKLAALAAARKKKDEERKASSAEQATQEYYASPANKSVALLDKLSGRGINQAYSSNKKQKMDVDGDARKGPGSLQPKEMSQATVLPLRTGASSSKDSKIGTIQNRPSHGGSIEIFNGSVKASPSTFARTMFGGHTDLRKSTVTPKPQQMFHFSYNTGLECAKAFNFTEPSPDDIVAKAQNLKGSKGVKPSSKQANHNKEASQAAEGVAALSIGESSRAKSKNLNVPAEFENSKGKDAVNFVVIGHVDAGKSTLMGRLLYDLNVVDQRTLDKFRREAEKIGKSSFALAWVLDQTTEERSRGVTMDIATKFFETEKTRFTILDAPGHQDFIPNMIAGASQADFAVLVLDASIGSFESGLKGQTKEHALLVRSMGVQRMIIAVNKMDTVNWSHDRFEEIQQQTSAFLTAAGFQTRNILFVPCSGLTGDNIARRAPNGIVPWYAGPTLVEQLETSEPTSRALEMPLRLTIGDIFRGGIQHPVSVSGRIEQGNLQVGDQVVTIPSQEKAYIKDIEVDQDTADWAVAGQNVVLHLTDIDSIHLKTGDVLCSPNSTLLPTSTLTVKILAFDHIMPMHVDVHRGRLHAPGRITQLVATLNKASGEVEKRKPKLIKPGNVARIKVEMDVKVPLEAPTRVVLRAGGETIAAGLLE